MKKERHNPNKPANKRNKHCPYYEEIPYGSGKFYCERGYWNLVCGGNPHNCIKQSLKVNAILKNRPEQWE